MYATDKENDIDFIGIWSRNREEYLYLEIAMVLFKIVPAAVYDSIGIDGINFAFKKCNLTTFFASSKQVDEFLNNYEKFTSLKNLISFEPLSDN